MAVAIRLRRAIGARTLALGPQPMIQASRSGAVKLKIKLETFDTQHMGQQMLGIETR